MPKGQLETWYIAGDYFAYDGSYSRAQLASGLACLTKPPVQRVYYGFFDTEAQLRLRGRHHYAAGETLHFKAAVFAEEALHYTFPRCLKWQAQVPLLTFGGGKLELPAVQSPAPRKPLYMDAVQSGVRE